MSTGDIKITGVQVASCSLPLNNAIVLGSVRITSRDYVCLRVQTDAGIEGFAIGYRSGGQSFESLCALSPRLVGRNPVMRREICSELEQTLLPVRASYSRALSLIEIALWDVTAKLAGLPLYALLGGSRTEVSALPVVGFSYGQRSVEEILDEIAGHYSAGEETVKVMIKGNDAIANSKYVSALAKASQGRVAVDAHWSFRTISEALDTCLRIDGCNLAFIEDPFLPQQWRLASELRQKLSTPLAVGEDVLDPYAFADVCQSIDILRVDATTCGGVAAAMSAISVAAVQGRKVLPHVFPYLHLQIACAHESVMGIEYIPEHTGTDPVRSLMVQFPQIRRGKFVVDDTPGAGCTLDWTSVESSAVQSQSFD